MIEQHRAGFVTVVGQTNVGKSTFLNAVLGEKLLITSPKPQTTRNRIRCILTRDAFQIVFVDTPGLHRARNKLGRHLLRETYRSLRDVDAFVYMVEPWGYVQDADRDPIERLAAHAKPLILLVNKVDTARSNALEETLLAYAGLGIFDELVPVSAKTGRGCEEAVDTISRALPESPLLFPPGMKSDQAESFLIEELIREKVTRLTYREIPYSVAIRVKWIRERPDGLIEIKAQVIVERESQKGILIGKAGRLIQRIGTEARVDIERLLGSHVFLDLIVTVQSSWTKDDQNIRQLTGSDTM